MTTYHIHIKGLVQGVGFRPHVYRVATGSGITGWVSNSANGVHILATADEEKLKKFYKELVAHPPVNAKITYHHAAQVAPQRFNDFYIQQSDGGKRPDLLITPDFGLCSECRHELFSPHSRRYRYPFTTCTQCGPRYSIITALPYDREHTTMSTYDQCWQCRDEYYTPENRRYFSQTNSCADCGIPMYLYNADGECICQEYDCILVMVLDALKNGHTVAVKGIGGYLLLCDATNSLAVSTLRENKRRPSKPLALLYTDLPTVEKDAVLSQEEKDMLQGVTAPIVLCALKAEPGTGLCANVVAPHLAKIGIMLPYSPLLALIAQGFKKPLVATSGNVSGSPILFNDIEALDALTGIADFFLTYDRDITVPQDDSVVQFSKKHGQPIILRRSRGLAPNYFSSPFAGDLTALAMGAELKSAFALLDNNRCYISQFLGDQSNYEAQQSYAHTLRHLTKLLRCEPEIVLVDKHPGYFVSQAGRELAEKHRLPVYEVQHHRAHFAAVLAENDLLETDESVLGVVWDGTGYGDDGQIWGGEFFTYDDGEIKRRAHFDYFPLLAGDKMAREPRLSALALTAGMDDATAFLRDKFSAREWDFYSQLLAGNDKTVLTSSVGRLLDGIACLLDVCDHSTYEGEAALQLEALAATCTERPGSSYAFYVEKDVVYWQPLVRQLLKDLAANVERNVIACKVHLSLAKLAAQVAAETGAQKVAFSGGVMQNALLVDLFIDELIDHLLYFHHQLSPNDECIAFGQLACLHIHERIGLSAANKIELLT